jgi:hypothetical protein
MSTKWVSVGSGGNTIATSTDLGVTWTGNGSTSFTTAGYGVAGPATYDVSTVTIGLYVAVGQGTNTIVTSTDGTTWIGRGATVFTNYCYGVAYGNGLWVAVGQGGNSIATSPDGLSWTGCGATVFTSYGYKVAYANGLWVAGGQGGNIIATSTDGITWTGRSFSVLTHVSDIAYGNGLWVAVGGGGNNIATSVDGITWTGRGGTTLTGSGRGVAYGNGLWVAVGGQGTAWVNTIVTSVDGITWTGRGATAFNSVGYSVAYGNNLWVAVGNGINTIVTSTDGIVWTGRGATIFDNTGYNGGNGLTYANNLWVAVGNGNTIATSVDGINWTGRGKTAITTAGFGVAYAAASIICTKPTFVAVGQGGNTLVGSTDGTTWRLTPYGSPFSTAGYGVSWNGKEWVAVGQGGNTIAYSTDGLQWTGNNSQILSTLGNDVAYGKDISGNGLWVVTGQGGNSIATSTTGLTWTGRGTTVFTTAGWCVAFGKDGSGNRLMVAVGQGTNTIATSTNGTTWTGRGATIFTTKGNGVTYANNLWIAVGQGGNSIATSVNGINWTGLGTSIFTQGNGIRYTNNLWVATGTGANTIATSTNGTTWIGRGATIFTTAGHDVLGPTTVEPMMTFTVPPRYIEEAPFTITPPISNSSGLITYTSSNASVATIDGTTVTIVGLGTTTISAFQESTDYYIFGTIDASFTVNKLVTVLTDFSVPEKSIGDEAFAIIPPTSNSDAEATFIYTSSNTTVATIVGTTITIVGAGTTTITAFQPSSARYASGTTTATFIVNKLITVLAEFSVPEKTFGDVSFNLVAPTTNRDGLITYTSSNLAVATISGSRVTIVGGGTATITAFQASTPIYVSGTTTAPLIVNQATTILSNFSVPTKTFGDASFNIVAPTTNSNGAFTYTSSDTTVATVSGSRISIVGRGTATITANQASTANYTSETIFTILTVNQATPVLSSFYVPATSISTPPFTLSPPTTNGNGTFTYTSSDPTVATIDGSLVTIIGLGTTAITALQSSTVNFKSASITEILTVLNKLPLSIGVGSGGNTIASSTDLGLTWTGRGATPFTTAGYGVAGPATYADPSLNGKLMISVYPTANSSFIFVDGFFKSGLPSTMPIDITTAKDVVYANGIWVIGAYNTTGGNSIAISSDGGNTWTGKILLSSGNYLQNLTYANNLWVAGVTIGSSPAIIYSSNNWATTTTVSNTIPNRDFESISFANGLWFTNYNSRIYSTNDSNITSTFILRDNQTIFPTQNIPRKFVGGKDNLGANLWITITNNGGGAISTGNTIAKSTNGTAWSNVPNTIFNNKNSSPTDLAYGKDGSGNGLWIICGYKSPSGSGFDTYGIILTSSDGTNWTTVLSLSTYNFASKLKWTGTEWYVFSTNGILKSVDGTNWSTTGNVGGNVYYFDVGQEVTYTKPTFIAVGQGGNTIATSNNGTTWTGANFGLFRTAGYGVGWNGKEWVAVGSGGNTIAYSSDGILWRSNSIVFSTQGNDVAYGKDNSGNGLWTVVGESNGNTIATSRDGLTWTGRGAATFTHRGWCVAFGKDGSGNRLMVAVGQGGNTIATSTNGTTWTGRGATIFTTRGTGVTYANNLWVAVGQGGNSIATSVNGINWTGLGTNIFTQGNGIRYTINLWVATGTGANTIATSTNGTTWIGRGTTVFTTAGHDVLGPTTVEPMMTFTVPPRYIEEAPFTITPPTTNSSGLITYTSSNASVATIDGTTVTIVGLGTTTISAFQESTEYYISGTIDASFTVNKLVTVLTDFSVPEKSIGDEAFAIIPPTSNSDAEATFIYTSSDTTVATIVGTTITIVGAGTTTITASQASSERYASATTTATFIVNKLITTLTDFSVPAKTFGDVSFNLVAPTINRDGAITYTSSNLAVATISGSRVTIVGGGTTTITAFQASTPIYVSGTITAPLVVNQATTILSNFSVPTKTFGNAAFNIVAPTTNGNGAITYTSSDITVATVSGTTITIVGGGTTTITANQASTTNYTAGTISATLIVNQATPTITNFVVPAKIIGDVSFSLVNPTSNSIGLFTYTSSNTDVATIEGNVVTIIRNGIVTITASQASTNKYISGSITGTLYVRLIPTITNFVIPSKTFGEVVYFNFPSPISDSSGYYTFTSSNTSVASIYSNAVNQVNEVSVYGGGTTTITAVQAMTDKYISGTITTTFTVNPATTVLSNFSVGSRIYGDFTNINGPSFSATPPATSRPYDKGGFTYTSSDTSVATINQYIITIVGAGTTTITATQATTSNYLSASISAPFIIAKATGVLSNFSVPDKVVGDASFSITNPASAANFNYGLTNPGPFTYTSSNLAVATIQGNVITVVGNGISTITAVQAATANYTSASITTTFKVRLSPVLSNFVIPAKIFGDADFTVTPPTSDSDGAFSYSSSNTAVAWFVGNVGKILGGGTTTVTATQYLTENHAIKSITTTFTVNPATPVLSNFYMYPRYISDSNAHMTAPTSNSIGTFTYTSSNLAVVGTIVKSQYGGGYQGPIVGLGSTTITAYQAATANYTGGSITTILQIVKNPNVLTNFVVPSLKFGDAPYTLRKPNSYSYGAFTYTSSNTSVVTISGEVITVVGIGSSIITANQETTPTYETGTTSGTLVVSAGLTGLANFVVPAKIFGDASFNLVAPTTSSPGAITYTSSNTAVATVTNNTITIVGAGTSTITANQASTTNYASGTITATLTVSKVTTVLSNFAIGAKAFGDASFNIVAPTTNSNGSFTYTSSNTAVATVSGSRITIIGIGTSTITASQATNTNYTAATTTTTLTVNKATTVLTNFSIPVKIFRNAPFSITAPTTNSNGAITYTSSNLAVATISGTTITIVGIGTSTITANQASTANYLAGTTTAVFQVNNATPVITNFVIPTKTFGDAPFSLVNPTSNSIGAFTYTSSNTAVATIAGNMVTIVGGGTATITATQASTADYDIGTSNATLTVGPATTVLSDFSVSSKTYGDASFNMVAPTTNSNGAFTYTSSNTAVATIVENVIMIVGAGTSTITAVQASTASYTSTSITASFQVGQGIPTLSFSIPTKTIIDAAYTITPPTSNSIGAFTYTSSNLAVATIVGSTVTMVGLGTTTITAVQANSVNYVPATISATLTVIKATPTLTNFSIPEKNLGNPSFIITPPTTESDGAITYTSSDTSVAIIINGNRISMKAIGTSIITAVQASTANYFSASITANFQVSLSTAVLNMIPFPQKTFGDIPFKVQASSVSIGAIAYTSSEPSVATIVGDMVTIVGAGTTSITATQDSWNNYASATTTTTMEVNPFTTVLTNFSIPIKKVGDASFSLVNPSSNRDGAFTYTSSDLTVATIDGNMVTIVRGGTSTITAVQTSTSNYTSETITSVLTVNRAIPALSNFVVPEKSFGDANFTLDAPSSNSNGAFTYTSSNAFVANVVGNVVYILGAGSCTINAVQASTASYTSGGITASFVVNKRTPTMTNFFDLTRTFGNAAFKLNPPTSNGGGAFTYTSSDTTVATVARDIVTIVGLGTSTITAVQVSSAHYTSGTISATLTVNQGASTLSNFIVPAKTAGDATFSLVAPRTRSDGAFTYTSSNPSVATIVGDVVTIVGGGTSTITANQESTSNFAAGIISAPFTVNRISTILTNFSVSEKTFGNASFNIIAPSSNSDGLITYTSSNTSVATIDGSMVTIVGAGNTTITAVQAMTPIYASATITVVFQVNPITTVLTNFAVPAKKPGDADFSIVPPSSNSDGLITYTSSNPAVATIVGDVVTIVGLGTSTITASQASTTNYTSRIITATLAVNLITTALSNFSVPAKNIADVSFSLVPPSSNSTGTFTYTSSNLLVATIAGDVVTLVGTGSCMITALQASTMNSISAEITAPLVVSRTSPVLTNFSVLTKDFGSTAFKLTPPTTNGVGAFTYTSSDLTVATIVKDIVTLVGIGSCTITAVQASTANFLSGTINTTLTVNQGTPALSNFVVPTKKIGDEAFNLLTPTSNSDGAFTYTSSDTSVATIDGSTVTIVGRGTSTITALQASTTNFLSGTITALFTINRITTVLTNFSVPVKTFGDVSFNIVDPSSNSDGTFTYTSSDLNVATIDGSTITIVGGGNATITAVQASTANYGSETISALFEVKQIKSLLSDFSVPTKIIGEEAFALVPPTTISDGAFTYTSSNPAVATIDGDIVTILALGNTTIRAIQASTPNYTSDTITTLFQVKLIRTVLTNFVVPTKTVGDVSFSLVAPTTNSSGVFTYRSSNLLVATVSQDVVTIVGTGNVTIIAFQESTENSTPAQITASLMVNKASNSISWFSVPEKVFGNAPFTLTPPTTASNGAFTYTSSNTSVATIVRDVVTIVGIGTSTITAVQARTANYEAGTITALFTVGEGTPVLTNFSVPTKIVGDAPFTIINPSSNSDGAFTYTSSNTDIATIVGTTVTIVGRGTSTITARQSSSTNYALGTITSTLQVNLIPTVLTNFAVATKTFGGATFTIVPPTTNSDGEFTYTSSDITVATIDDDVVTIVGAGNAIITAVQASTNSYGVGTTTALFTVDPIRTVLTNFAIPAKIFGEGDFSIARPTTASNGAITYTSSNLTVATIENDVITIVGLGSSIITATQVATDDYTSAKITALFDVNLITTVLSNFGVPAKILGDAPFTIDSPTTNTAGAFTYTSSNLLVATIIADVVTVVGVGSCTITAVQASTPNSTSATITAPLVVSKRSPTITNFSIPDKVFGNAAFKLTPPTTNNSVGAFTYTSSDATVATIVRDVVTIIGVGSATITAVQAGTTNFTSGTITTTLTVNSGTPVLTNFSVPTKIAGSAPFSLVAPQSISDGAFTYTSSNTDVATIDGDVVTIVGAGTTTISASQASTEKYLSGSVTTTFTVNQITTVLTDFAVVSKALGNADFSLVPPTTNSDGAITYTSSNLAVATIVGDVVTIVGGGISTITAVQSGTTNYTSATITTLFQVSALTTVLSNFGMPTRAVGNAPFTITPPTTNGDGAFTYTSLNRTIVTISGDIVTIVGAGSTTIRAVQASTANYTSATISALMIVNKGTPGITNFVMPVKEIGMSDFSIINPTSPSTGEFTYTSSNIKVATIFKNIVSIKSIGTCTITATQAMSANYMAETLTTQFVVNQMSPTLSTPFNVPATKMVGDKTFKLIAPKSNSISPFVFTSSDITVVKLAKDAVTIVGAGTAIISATQAATKSYGPRTVTGTITVTKKTALLNNFIIPPKIIGTAPFVIPPPTINSNGLITYTSSDTSVATIAGNMVTIVGVGNTTITANQASNVNFTSGTISTPLVVNLPTPQLGPLQITNKSLSNVSYDIVDPTKPINNTGAWTYSSLDLTKATVTGNVVTLLDVGIVTIRATLSSDSLYNSVILMTQFSISAQDVAPSSFVFIKSSEVVAAIPATVISSLNVILPATVANPANIAKFNPTLGTIAEKQANQNMVVNTLCNIFSIASVISVPTTLLYVPPAFNKTKLKTIKIVIPTGTTVNSPLVINTISTDSAVAFLCSFVGIGQCVRLNGVGSFAGNFMLITRGANNTYMITRTTKANVTATSTATNGEIITFVGMTTMIGYN